jgi:hypothetical protein
MMLSCEGVRHPPALVSSRDICRIGGTLGVKRRYNGTVAALQLHDRYPIRDDSYDRYAQLPKAFMR